MRVGFCLDGKDADPIDNIIYMKSKAEIQDYFSSLSDSSGGLTSFLSDSSRDEVFDRLGRIEEDPISKVQLNQLLLMADEAGMTYSCYEYYWHTAPQKHPYDVKTVFGFEEYFLTGGELIVSLAHLRWGLTRIYIDAILFFGSVKYGYRTLRQKRKEQLEGFFSAKMMPTEFFTKRGKALEFCEISKDRRYLISEMACKSYGDGAPTDSDLHKALMSRFKEAVALGRTRLSFKELLFDKALSPLDQTQQSLFSFSVDEILDEEVGSEEELSEKFRGIAHKFSDARSSALKNTDLYLSLVNDLDVYVATSMRTRQDFRDMADHCETIFHDVRLKELNLRYFDPTISAADGHEDKGLIECLMVKCAKALVYMAGEKESFGKDAEAAMALSLGKPVVFFCSQEQRANFYKYTHPLSRLINFGTGVAVGAIVTDNIQEVPELLWRFFNNKMEFDLVQEKPGYFKLKERLTQSVVRLQTNNKLLTKSFWTYYHTQAGLKIDP